MFSNEDLLSFIQSFEELTLKLKTVDQTLNGYETFNTSVFKIVCEKITCLTKESISIVNKIESDLNNSFQPTENFSGTHQTLIDPNQDPCQSSGYNPFTYGENSNIGNQVNDQLNNNHNSANIGHQDSHPTINNHTSSNFCNQNSDPQYCYHPSNQHNANNVFNPTSTNQLNINNNFYMQNEQNNNFTIPSNIITSNHTFITNNNYTNNNNNNNNNQFYPSNENNLNNFPNHYPLDATSERYTANTQSNIITSNHAFITQNNNNFTIPSNIITSNHALITQNNNYSNNNQFYPSNENNLNNFPNHYPLDTASERYTANTRSNIITSNHAFITQNNNYTNNNNNQFYPSNENNLNNFPNHYPLDTASERYTANIQSNTTVVYLPNDHVANYNYQNNSVDNYNNQTNINNISNDDPKINISNESRLATTKSSLIEITAELENIIKFSQFYLIIQHNNNDDRLLEIDHFLYDENNNNLGKSTIIDRPMIVTAKIKIIKKPREKTTNISFTFYLLNFNKIVVAEATSNTFQISTHIGQFTNYKSDVTSFKDMENGTFKLNGTGFKQSLDIKLKLVRYDGIEHIISYGDITVHDDLKSLTVKMPPGISKSNVRSFLVSYEKSI